MLQEFAEHGHDFTDIGRPLVAYLQRRQHADRDRYRTDFAVVAELLSHADTLTGHDRLSVIALAAEALQAARHAQGVGLWWADGVDIEKAALTAERVTVIALLECALIATESALGRVKFALAK